MHCFINKKFFNSKELLVFNYALLILLSSCSVSKQIAQQAETILLKDSAISSGHIGISIYEPATGRYWYNHDAEKYFVPASNTKLFTLYAGMKYLGDSLVGIRYETRGDSTILYPSGDPSFLHSDYKYNPVFDFLKTRKKVFLSEKILFTDFLGKGWAWDDFKEGYMAQRSPMPVYGNIVKLKWVNADSLSIYPRYFKGQAGIMEKMSNGFEVIKDFEDNHLVFIHGEEKNKEVPFRPDETTVYHLLKDTLKTEIGFDYVSSRRNTNPGTIIHSQLSDSLFKPMMHRSDNFFAEQTLLMVSNERLGYMSTDAIIDTLLKADLTDIPQKPKWVDGSGLSRYNLFTPQAFIYILGKLNTEFGWDRLRNILPTGGKGTLKSYYIKDSGSIYAKTGTLSNHCAISGFLITNKGKLLIFSILANHYQTGATPIRKATELFLEAILKKY